MIVMETVTFGGSGLDRAAHLRTKISDLLAGKQTCAIAIWNGKPLISTTSGNVLRLAPGHPIFSDSNGDFLFLGLEGETSVFATTLQNFDPHLDEPIDSAFLDRSTQSHPAVDEAEFAELRAIMAHLNPRDAELVATAKAVLGWHNSHRFCSACGQESNWADAGWRRHCPTCKTSHFPRTDPVVIMLVEHENKVLIGRSPGWPEGMYSLLAGFLEPGETIEAAVRREIFEEAGIKVGKVTYLASQPWAFPSSLMIGCWGEALNNEITLDINELEDARWISKKELSMASDGTHPTIRPARKGSIAHFLLERWLNHG